MSKNDITGDDIKSKVVTDKFRDGHDRIFGPKCHFCGAPTEHGEDSCDKCNAESYALEEEETRGEE